ncbi:uncharacterized protein V6R79_014036 [Siganus canaliculatus]
MTFPRLRFNPLASEECGRRWQTASVADLRSSKAPETLPVGQLSNEMLDGFSVRPDGGWMESGPQADCMTVIQPNVSFIRV